MGELYEPYPKLPKNIRQIGERDQIVRVYVEDYVNTYLKRLQPAGGADLRVGLLLGNAETHENIPYVFIDGALEMDGVAQEGERVQFSEDAWKKAYQDVEKMFPRRTVQGWFLCGNPGCTLSPLNYWKQHGQYFTGSHQLMYLNSGLEGEEAIYITSPDGFYKLRGYCIFYERNQMMQDYMIQRRDQQRVEIPGEDPVIRDFRKRMDQNKTQAQRHRGTVGALTGLCSVLAVTVLAGGVVMFNNYQKLSQMEDVIASVWPEGAVTEDVSGKGESTAASPDYVMDHSFGQTEPETMSPTRPDPAQSQTEENLAGTVEETRQETEAAEETTSPQALAAAAPAEGQAWEPDTSQYQVYQVAPGDTLYGICFKLYQNLSHLDEIRRINGLTDENSIYAGQELLVP